MAEATAVLCILYVAVGAGSTWVFGRLDGNEADPEREVGPAIAILSGVLWPFTWLYFTAFNRADKRRTALSVLGRNDSEETK